MTKHILLYLSLALTLLNSTLTPQARTEDATQRVSALEREIVTLKSENKSLRVENERLRQAVEQQKTVGINTTTTPRPALQPARPASGVAYWITTASSKRHNSGCRYYQNPKGRPCGADEGVAGRFCGG